MNVVLDACSIINLINGNLLQKVILLPSYKYFIGELLFEQELLNNIQKIKIQACIDNKNIMLLNSIITLSEFNTLKSLYDLGLGETECIALCKRFDYHISTDDLKARYSAEKELGKEKVIGSLYFLKKLKETGITSTEESYKSYLSMKKAGGFLPKIDQSFF